MPQIVEDIKTGLKGIRGAGDAIRGEAMAATDQAFERNPHDPAAIESRERNKAVAGKGKMDIDGADEMIARREKAGEVRRGEVPEASTGVAPGTGRTTGAPTGATTTAPSTTGATPTTGAVDPMTGAANPAANMTETPKYA
jgi:hypothetical protein